MPHAASKALQMLPTESTPDQQDVDRALAGERAHAGYVAKAGDLVLAREGRWRVTHVRSSISASRQAETRAPAQPSPPQPVRVVTLRGADHENRWQQCTLLEPFDRVAPWLTHATPRVLSRKRWMRALGVLAASSGAGLNTAWPHGMLAVADANVTLLAHQLTPLLAILQGMASRVLIADGVGLGKTVQAALVLRALAARGRAARVLIAVPAGLRDQWQQELRERVGLPADVIDAATLAARVRQLPSDINPWTQPGTSIASLDFLKQDVVLHGLSSITWDALIVDEAHALTAGTDRAAAAHLLAQHSRVVLLLTATPHDGSEAAFDALCRIGQLVDRDRSVRGGHSGVAGADADDGSAGGDPIAIFRRTQSSLGLANPRRERVLRVRPTPTEQRLHALLARYVTRVEREHDAEQPAALAMSVLQKRATSSAWSLLRSLERRLELLSREGAADAPSAPREQTGLPFEGGLPFVEVATGATPSSPLREDLAGDMGAACDRDPAGEADPADEEPLAVLSAPGLANVQVERAWLSLLIQIARRAAHHESKLRALRRLLRRVRERAIIYTEYRDTLAHVADTLPRERALSTVILHGGLTRDARTDALRDFSSGDATLLCATDAGGEGLNLHQRCRLVINVELPWNPNRLEQRIGRVDRLGQSRTVHAIHFVLAGTSEEALLKTLNVRVNNIATALGERPQAGRPTANGLAASGPAESRPADDVSAAPVPALGRAAEPFRPEDPQSPACLWPARLWPDLSTEADAVVRALEYVRVLHTSAGHGDASGKRGEASCKRNGKHSIDLELEGFDLELKGGVPWIATARRRRRGPLADLAPGVLCIWRTCVRLDGAASSTARELITALRVPQLHGFQLPVHRSAANRRQLWQRLLDSNLRDLMLCRLDAFVRSTIEGWNERERDFQERAVARDAAISRAVHARWTRLEAHSCQERRQPLLFADIAADREARQPSQWRAPPPDARPMLSDASSGPSADVDHALLLLLVLQ